MGFRGASRCLRSGQEMILRCSTSPRSTFFSPRSLHSAHHDSWRHADLAGAARYGTCGIWGCRRYLIRREGVHPCNFSRTSNLFTHLKAFVSDSPAGRPPLYLPVSALVIILVSS